MPKHSETYFPSQGRQITGQFFGWMSKRGNMASDLNNNNCLPGTPLPTTDIYRSVRQVPDLADEGDVTALAFPHLQFFIWVSARSPPFKGSQQNVISLTTEPRRPTLIKINVNYLQREKGEYFLELLRPTCCISRGKDGWTDRKKERLLDQLFLWGRNTNKSVDG